ncbi:MAG: hypothetical protein OEO83_12675 [Alphaproteobacteria bacterium]|nr:hypothetical protein [Alphaproteobacteria bacterium]
MDELDTLLEDIARVGDVVAAARDLIEEGQIINIQPLEKEVEELCGRMTSLEAAAAKKVQPVLLGLMEELNHLAETMGERHRELTGALRSLSRHGNAASAYTARPTGTKTST